MLLCAIFASVYTSKWWGNMRVCQTPFMVQHMNCLGTLYQYSLSKAPSCVRFIPPLDQCLQCMHKCRCHAPMRTTRPVYVRIWLFLPVPVWIVQFWLSTGGQGPMIDEIMCWLLRAIVDHERMVSIITAWGVRWTDCPIVRRSFNQR